MNGTDKTGGRDRALRRLRMYVWTGAAYVCVAIVWLYVAWRRGDLAQPINLIWLTGAVIFALGIIRSLRHLPAARGGEIGEPDERAQLAAGKAALAAVRYMIAVMAIAVGVQAGTTGSLPLTTSVLWVALIGLFLGHYVHYLRKMG